ncbi:MAG: serine hydrolase domain-containing protein [bacterium]
MLRFVMFCLFLISVNTIYSQNTTLDSLLKTIVKENEVCGLSVAVIKNDSLVFYNGYGFRDLELKLPVNDNTKFRIASISKMITTTTLLTLFDKGMFKLDDDVSSYLGFKLRNPKFPNDTITFKKLLSHTSSILDGSKYDDFLNASKTDNPPALTDLFSPDGEFYTDDIWMDNSPNDGYFTYANINFGIAGTIIEKLTGNRFDVVAYENVLKPLGINGGFNVDNLDDINNLAAIYRMENSVWVPQFDNYKGIKPNRDFSKYVIGSNGVIFSPTGGLRVTAADLAKFMTAHQNNGILGNIRILAEKTTKTMHKSQWVYNGSNCDSASISMQNYALGNYKRYDFIPGETLIGHSGGAYGLVSDMYYSSEKKFGIVVICSGGILKKGNSSNRTKLEEDVFTAVYSAFEGFDK